MARRKQIIKKRFNNFIQDERGEIDKLVALVILFLCLSVFISFVEPFVIRNKVVLLTKEVVEETEYIGQVDQSYVENLIDKYGLRKYNPSYSFSGNIMPSGKIQLREEFTFRITLDYTLILANIGDKIKIPLPISRELTGRSQVYYRPSDL